METAQIQKIISDQFADSGSVTDLHELLIAVAERQGAQPDKLELSRGASFVYSYIEQVPYLLTVAWTSARNVGLEKEMASILEMVESYWIEDDDVIPDTLGIIGLLDDAYCSLLSLQTVSDLYRMQSGKHLFPEDLTAANKIMRKIIGEPYSTELDDITAAAITDADVRESVKALASPEKQRLLESQATIWNHGPVNELPVSQLTGLGLIED
ncbi:MAG: hypothetical protein OQJ84_03805 [Xanthomonadales bacterium]|nr:hypothetical protein [Xanthomonadales bacterium]